MTAWTEEEWLSYDAWVREKFPEEVAKWGDHAPKWDDPLPSQTEPRPRCGREPRSAESKPPCGQAALWLDDVLREVDAPTARVVAQQLARLAGDDVQVITTRRALADAVGRRDKAGHTRAYAESGVDTLTNGGWLRVEPTPGRNGGTTFHLMPGDLSPGQAAPVLVAPKTTKASGPRKSLVVYRPRFGPGQGDAARADAARRSKGYSSATSVMASKG